MSGCFANLRTPIASAAQRPDAPLPIKRIARGVPPSIKPNPLLQTQLPVLATATAFTLLTADPALAMQIHMEPSNALSLPTWAVHTSSVIEWMVAMALMWRYAEVSGREAFKGMSWGMMPSLAAAMCACTWHFFYNSPDLEFLVTMQSTLTIIGNATCWWAAYRIYKQAQGEQQA